MKPPVRHVLKAVVFSFTLTLVAVRPASAVVIDFDDLRPGTVFCTMCGNIPHFAPQNIILTAGRRIELTRFRPFTSQDNSHSGAVAVVRNAGSPQLWDPRGNYLNVGDGVLEFDIRDSTDRLYFDFLVDADGKSHYMLDINGQVEKTIDIFSLDGISVAGVSISILTPTVRPPGSIGWHTLVLDGLVNSFAFGGDRFSIDNIRYSDQDSTDVLEPASFLLLGSGVLGLCRRGKAKDSVPA